MRIRENDRGRSANIARKLQKNIYCIIDVLQWSISKRKKWSARFPVRRKWTREKETKRRCQSEVRWGSDRAYKCEGGSINRPHKPNYQDGHRLFTVKKSKKKYKSRTYIRYRVRQLIHVTLLRRVARNSAQFPAVHRAVARFTLSKQPWINPCSLLHERIITLPLLLRDPNEWTYLYVDSTWIHVRGVVIE